jgi:hypothetical protein
MYLPEEIYSWLVDAKLLPNNGTPPLHSGELDDKGKVTLPAKETASLESGFVVGEILRKIASSTGQKAPNALANVKSDSSKNTKLTNWNFIWYVYPDAG